MYLRRARLALTATLSATAIAVGVAACSDSTGPSSNGPPGSGITVTNAQLVNSLLVVDDVSIRLLPAIGNLAGTLELSGAFGSLAQSVAGRDAEGVLANVARGRTALAQIRQQTDIVQYPDLDAIELALRDAELLVRPPSS